MGPRDHPLMDVSRTPGVGRRTRSAVRRFHLNLAEGMRRHTLVIVLIYRFAGVAIVERTEYSAGFDGRRVAVPTRRFQIRFLQSFVESSSLKESSRLLRRLRGTDARRIEV